MKAGRSVLQNLGDEVGHCVYEASSHIPVCPEADKRPKATLKLHRMI